MDKTTKFILGLIAVSLIGINVQMWNGKLIKDAKADTGVTKIAICNDDGSRCAIVDNGYNLSIKNYGF